MTTTGATLLPIRLESTWDKPLANSLSLGCPKCPDYRLCGGLHTSDGAFDCRDRCRCSDRTTCKFVCRFNPVNFHDRLREVHGFDLSNTPRAPVLPIPEMPSVVPWILHGSTRASELDEGYVAVPLRALFNKSSGTPKFHSREDLYARLRLRHDALLIATGVAEDHFIERCWGYSSPEFWAKLAGLGISAYTVPNFSVMNDVPRQDNLHAMKRIALLWSTMLQAGLPTALHLNARTERDYARWERFVAERAEVMAVAFEFTTGANNIGRVEFHIERLCALAAATGRPLTLFVRGGVRHLAELRSNFHRVVSFDTTPFLKTVRRQRAVVAAGERMRWESARGTFKKGRPLDALLAHNIELSRRFIVNPPQQFMHSRSTSRKAAQHADAETPQGSLSPGFEFPALKDPFAA